ncbi:unnamed protein product [Blepharisma stoltei]|uniref:Uncharacterized protein n=1 Tax=Blepharisma stoltei TaxID=1481888 RepID=A0AAU9JKP4_9CILI|nr:unnamed protein product [Blepharisma stoltei]
MDMENSAILNDKYSSEIPKKSIKELEAIRNANEQNENYIEAWKTHKAILERIKEENRKHEETLIEQQEINHYEMIVDFKSEYALFRDRWNELISENYKKFKDARDKAKSDFEKELQSAKEQLEKSIQIMPIFSAELTTLKNIQNEMARNKEYEMADIIKLYLIEFENEEKRNWKMIREEEIKIKLDEMKAKHKIGMKNIDFLEKTEMEKLKSQRYKERIDLINKYQKAKGIYENAHRLIALESFNKNQCTLALGYIAAIFLIIFILNL